MPETTRCLDCADFDDANWYRQAGVHRDFLLPKETTPISTVFCGKMQVKDLKRMEWNQSKIPPPPATTAEVGYPTCWRSRASPARTQGIIRMTKITLRVLDGANRGETYENILLPVTIGREEGNSIQLNDERVSRVHVRIQQDHDDLVLTDLDSTNGSRVNNEEVQLRILRYGDLITVGRSTLVYGSREQIQDRLQSNSDAPGSKPNNKAEVSRRNEAEVSKSGSIFQSTPPKLPERLSPGQAAQLSEVIEYLHHHVREIVSEAEIKPRQQSIEISAEMWQQIVEVQARLAEYLDRIGQPS
jgi:pSer/pThr/pTyr-binding forkhead associated (FHA) protein